MFLIRWLLKVTGYIPGLILFGPKKFYLGSMKSTTRVKGPAIISMNHTGFLDYVVALLMFPFRRMDVLVSEAMYNYSPVFRFMLKAMGVIKVPAFTGDMAAVNAAMGKLKEGHLVLIFPEGRIETSKDLFEYKQAAALLAISSKAPVLPIFHDGNIGPGKRDKVFIGDWMYAADYTSPEDSLSQGAAKFTDAIFEKTKLFHDNYYRFFFSKTEKKPKRKVTFPYLFVKYTAKPMVDCLIPPKVICENEVAKMAFYNQKKMLVICNHAWWLDNPLIHLIFWKRHVRSVAAKDVAEKNAAQKMMQTIMGCIFIDRYGYDWASIKQCLEILNDDGCVAICPEGVFNFEDKLIPFQKGAAMMAVMTGATVVPVYLNCAYKPFHRSYIYVAEPVSFEGGPAANNLEDVNQKMEEALENARRLAYDMTPKKEQEIIAESRRKNKIKVARF